MAVNHKEFSINLDKLLDKINNSVERVIKGVVFEVHRALLQPAPLGTPVLTGWAKSNWIISKDMPRPFPVGSKENVGTAISEQKRSLSSFLNNSLNDVNMIYINNGVPYISFLNDGSSKKLYKNFVGIAMQRGIMNLNKNKVIK